ncbi:HNH endonuclease [Angustibacter aerolatus]|uniref:HNH endonuclease n=1 Tax=Angustibacter aerolatus TaxID=1162965 RepID=A0ABQ6JHN8_9ACTN|nr:HNH endonuclease [Angustibacter aerolatus]GMA86350.1 HNH endonuclease [Angustibacter aerolatus]
MRTLVLNAGYEPLSVVSFKRAVVLVLAGKAMVLAESGERLRSADLTLATPSVILLVRYVRAPRRHGVSVTRRGVLRRDGHRCAYCGGAASTVDHVLPRSRGGADSWTNLVGCCLRCNGVKGDRTPEEMGWQARVRPAVPSGALWALRGSDVVDPQWAEFLQAA